MGSSGSKPNVAESSSPAGGGGPSKSRSKSSRTRVHFQSSCLGSHDIENDHDEQAREVGVDSPCANPIKSDSEHVIPERYRKVKVEHSGEMASISANAELDEWGQSNLSDNVSRGGSTSSQGFSSQSLNLSGRFFSRFSFFRGNVSFRLNRAASLGSSRPYPVSSTSFTSPSEEEELHVGRGSGNGLVNRKGTRLGCDLLPACLINKSPGPHYEESNSGNRCLNPSTSDFSGSIQDDQILSSQDNSRDIDSGVDFGVSLHSPRNRSESEGTEIRFPERRTAGAREPVERNVRFSRALSVGRLRDRVLRRSSFPDLRFCPVQQEGEVRDVIQGVVPGARASEENAFTLSTSSNNMSSSVSSGQVYEVEGSRGRESRYRDLLEHGSNFIERRRRIRSQVRALQRLGSRFENLSGHERSCILSGQHRTGQCTCRLNNRDVNSNDDTNARASISRIVMLAEALFEVLDEIHQQSVVLSSRPSISSLGSVPAPIEVVDSLPLKLYNKSQKHLNEEAAQCYICLVEYEEGDSVRRLPCLHEFHRTCVDKWLKEIHRICPLCRGDICRPDSVTTEG